MKLLKNVLLIGFIICAFLVAIIIISRNPQQRSSGIQISASFYPLYFFASEIAKNKAEISLITPAGIEPHDYEPSTQDIVDIEKSDMLILNGEVEPWGEKIKRNIVGSKVKIVTTGQGLFTQQLPEKGKFVKDPHIWLDPLLAKKQVEKITQGLLEIDQKNADFYKQNGLELEKKLEKLDADYKAALMNCEKKDIVTSHAAFSYLARQYDFHQVAISGLSPNEEPSVQQLAEIANFAKKNDIKFIFFESLASPKLSQTIASEIGAEALVLDPIEGISEDNIRQGKNYFTVMEDNLLNLKKALVCK